MIIIASSIARGRERTMVSIVTTMKSRNSIVLGQRSSFGHPYYGHLKRVKSKYPLISIKWLHRKLKFKTRRDHIFSGYWPLTMCLVKKEKKNDRGLIAGKLAIKGPCCSEAINANPRLKINRRTFFFKKTNVFYCFFCYFEIVQTQNRGS